MTAPTSRRAIGIALAPGRLIATRLAADGGASIVESSVDAPANAIPDLEALVRAFRGVQQADSSARVAHIALLPPLAEVRWLDLPPLAADELRPLIERDSSRYFPVGVVPHVVQVLAGERAARTPGRGTLVAYAREQLVRDVLEAAAACGWRVASLSSAATAWAAAERPTEDGGTKRTLHVRMGGRVDTLVIGERGLVSLRRRTTASMASTEPGEEMDEIAACRSAARHAALPDHCSLWPAEMYARRRGRVLRDARLFGAASLLLLSLGAVLGWRTLDSELAEVTAARRRIAPEVTSVVERRADLERGTRLLEAMRGFEGDVPAWTGLIEAVERALPADAALVSLRVIADTLFLVGDAERAGPVLEALGSDAFLRSVRSSSPIQQQVERGEVVAERFSIRADLPRPSTP